MHWVIACLGALAIATAAITRRLGLIVIALVLIAGTLCLAYWQAMPTGTTTGYWTFGAVGWACLGMLLLAAVAIGARTRRRLVVA